MPDKFFARLDIYFSMIWKSHIPQEIAALYEVHDYHHAAAILATEFPEQLNDLCSALREFRIHQSDLTEGGGNESRIPKRISGILRPLGWTCENLTAELVVNDETVRQSTHKIDYVKGRVAFDLEWNSKDQTFDRDLSAFGRFFEFNRISVGVILTRSVQLNSVFTELQIMKKYGASTTWMGKLLPRLDSGRSGGCPVLALGITPAIIDKD